MHTHAPHKQYKRYTHMVAGVDTRDPEANAELQGYIALWLMILRIVGPHKTSAQRAAVAPGSNGAAPYISTMPAHPDLNPHAYAKLCTRTIEHCC